MNFNCQKVLTFWAEVIHFIRQIVTGENTRAITLNWESSEALRLHKQSCNHSALVGKSVVKGSFI